MNEGAGSYKDTEEIGNGAQKKEKTEVALRPLDVCAVVLLRRRRIRHNINQIGTLSTSVCCAMTCIGQLATPRCIDPPNLTSIEPTTHPGLIDDGNTGLLRALAPCDSGVSGRSGLSPSTASKYCTLLSM